MVTLVIHTTVEKILTQISAENMILMSLELLYNAADVVVEVPGTSAQRIGEMKLKKNQK